MKHEETVSSPVNGFLSNLPPWPSNTEDHTFERTIKYFNKDFILVVTRLQKTNGLPKILALILNSYKRTVKYWPDSPRSEVDCID